MKKILIVYLFCLTIQDTNATIYYVDDASNTNDVWTPAATGNNANNGTSITTPKATIANVLSTYVLGFGDIIRVDAGSYTETGINITTSDDGSSSGYVTITGAGNTLTIFTTVATDHTFDFATASVQYLKIMDLKIVKNTTFYNAVNFSLTGINNIWFENCVFTQAANNEVVYGDNPSTTSCSYIKFNNCTITNTSTSTDADGIELIDNFDNTTVSNSTFNISGSSIGLYIDNSDASYEPTGLDLTTNTINMTHATSANVRGILMRGKAAASIYSNTVTNSSTSTSSIAICLTHHNDVTLIPNNTNIYSNIVTSYGTGVGVDGYDASSPASTINVYSNTVTMSSSASGNVGIKMTYAGSSGKTIKIYSNRVISGNYGINLVNNVTYCQVYNNYVSNNAFGFYSGSSTNNNTDIYYNSFYGTTNGGYLAQLSTTHNIKNNIFYTTSASSTDYGLEIISNATLATSMDYNLYYFPNGAKAGYFGSAYSTLANWKAVDKVAGATLGEENGQTGDPIYDNGASNDLDINSTSSKAYKLGIPISLFTTDIYSTSRDAIAPNIGAFENTIALPIELIYFNAIPNDRVVELKWQTLTEINNDYFTLEKSNDGKSFTFLEEIEAAGTSFSTMNYSVIDKDPYIGISYYRLTQTDFDGKSTSFIASVTIAPDYVLSPNPNYGNFYVNGISGNKSFEVIVTDGKGAVVENSRSNENGVDFIQLKEVTEGVYYVKIKSDKTERVEKIMIMQ